MRIKASLCPSTDEDKTVTISLEDLGFTEQEWNELEEHEQQEAIVTYVDDMPNQPYWEVEGWEEV